MIATLVMGGLGSLVAAGCEGQSAPRGLGEPLQVRNGQFIEGDLPGSPPLAEDAGADAGTGSASVGPSVSAVILASQFVVTGGDKGISGRASGQSSSIGARFADMGTGYWVVPIQGADPQFPGQLTFSLNADFNPNDPSGTHALLFAAIDGRGRAGPQFQVPLCVLGRIPDNLHECDPTSPLPAAVFSMQWDVDFDADLHVITPEGLDINPKNPTGIVIDGGTRPPADAPRIDRDSLRGCVPDGLRQEDLVFPKRPTGTFSIYADPFDPCGKPAVRFKLTVYEATGGKLQPKFTRSGELLSSQATGGASPGLFVVQYPFGS